MGVRAGRIAIRPAPFLFGQTLGAVLPRLAESFSAVLHSPPLEIHKVFLRGVLLVLRKNLPSSRDNPTSRACLVQVFWDFQGEKCYEIFLRAKAESYF